MFNTGGRDRQWSPKQGRLIGQVLYCRECLLILKGEAHASPKHRSGKGGEPVMKMYNHVKYAVRFPGGWR